VPLPANQTLTDPQRLRAWLDQLPWLDTRRASSCVLQVLERLSRQTGLSWHQRDALLQVCHPYVHQLVDALEQTLLDVPLPLTDSHQDDARRLLQLCDAMAENHTRLVFDDRADRSDTTTLSETLGRTLEWLARQARHQAQIYAPVDETFWRTFYRIYRLIEKEELLSAGSEAQAALRIQVFRILLFHLAGPQRFRQRELQQIDRFLCHYGQWAMIRRQPGFRNIKAGFFFDCEAPSPPCSVKLLKQVEPPPGEVRFLFLQAVTRKLLDYVSSARPEGFETLPLVQARKLALRLAHLYGAPRQRRWRRFEEKSACRLVVGLEDLIAVLDRQGQVHEELRELMPQAPKEQDATVLFAADFELLPQEGASEADPSRCRSEVDCFQFLQRAKPATSWEDIWSSSGAHIDPRAVHFSGRLTDASARGYRLVWLDHSVARLKVGEIVTVFQGQNDPEIAAIRWLRSHPDHSVTAGVELLSFTAQVVVVSLQIPDNRRLEPRRDWGLLLPEQPVTGQPTCLMAPAFTWQKGQWVDIYRSRNDKTGYSLTRLLDSTPAYDLFALEPIS